MSQEIYSLISACMNDIEAIGKDSRNTKQGYNFRGIDAVYNALQPVLSKHKVLVVPEVIDQRREDVTNQNGTQLHYSILTVKYTFYAPDGSSVSAVVVGEGMDTGDKASNKAMSVAFKYACFQVFCIPTDEMVDPDSESHEAKRKAPAAQKKPAAKKPAPPDPEPPEPPTCPICGKPVNGAIKDKKQISPEEVLKKLGCCYKCHQSKSAKKNEKPAPPSEQPPPPKSPRQLEVIKLKHEAGITGEQVVEFMQDNFEKSKVDDLDETEYDILCAMLMQSRQEESQ